MGDFLRLLAAVVVESGGECTRGIGSFVELFGGIDKKDRHLGSRSVSWWCCGQLRDSDGSDQVYG